MNLTASLIYAFTLPFASIATTYLYADPVVLEHLEVETTGTRTVLPAES